MPIFARVLQWLLWQSRWAMLIPVLGLLAAGVYFAIQTGIEVLHALGADSVTEALRQTIGAIDLALLAAVLGIFALGLYELFIGDVEFPDNSLSNVLVIKSLDDLKGKLGQVILMILIVKFFEKALEFKPQGPLDYLYFAAAVALLSAALWLVQGKKESSS